MPAKFTRSARLDRRHAMLSASAALLLMGNASGRRLPKLERGERGRVSRIVDGDSFVMTLNDGSELSVRLSSLEAPHMSRRGKSDLPFARQAQAGLSALVKGRQVGLSYGGSRRDRFGRAVAQVHTLGPDGTQDLWIQGEMVRLGLARVYSWKGELSDLDALYRLESGARTRQRGLWADPHYAVRTTDANRLAQDVDSWQIVEGVVISTADVRGRTYLNFGADYKTDFTVTIAKKNAKAFKAMDPISLTGAQVRVRGWIEMINGPMIWIDHPGRLEILS